MTFQKIFIIFLFFVFFSIGNYVFAEEPAIYSQSAILMDANTGDILYQKNAQALMFPASTTKILTAIVAIENCDLSEKITASAPAITSIKSGYTNANIQVGETLSMEDLLYALLLKSANEAANVIAERVGGSTENFANMLNAKAIELGCTSTHFVNANGIHADNHFTTAQDLAIMTKYGMQNETFKKIICTKQYTLPATEQHPAEDRILINTNSLMAENSQFYYPHVIAGKTGFTTQAKNCLVCVSEKDGLSLISVVLHAETTEDGRSARYLDTINLLEYGNNNFQSHAVLSEIEEQKSSSISDTTNSNESSETLLKPLENTSEASTIDFRWLGYIFILLVFLRLLIAYFKKHIIIYRSEKLKKRARKYLNP